MAKRVAPSESEPPPSLPHDHDREGGQPYAKEVDDYKGGVASPPREQRGREAGPSARVTKAPAKK
jgi:hypothetical protein